MKIVLFRYDTGLLPLFPSGMMNAAAPEGTPPRRLVTKNLKKFPARRASQEALRRESIVKTIFMVEAWTESIHVCFYKPKKWDIQFLAKWRIR